MTFKVGDVVILQNLTRITHLNGAEGVIEKIEGPISSKHESTGERRETIVYTVRVVGQEYWFWHEHLRLKRPPQELSSWHKIEEICGWSPKELSSA